MAYGTKPSGKGKPSTYPYGQSGGNEMIANKKGLKLRNKISKEWNRGPAQMTGGRTKGK